MLMGLLALSGHLSLSTCFEISKIFVRSVLTLGLGGHKAAVKILVLVHIPGDQA